MASVKNRLIEIAEQLSRDEQAALLEYAEFMLTRSVHAQTLAIPEPVEISRPDEETVIAAMRRLSDTYPMLNKDTLLNETASLVSQNLLQGRAAVEVIDELEVIFSKQYEILIEELKQGSAE